MASQDEGERARPIAPSHVHDIITGGIEGGLGYAAIDPFTEKILHGKALQSPLREGWAALGKRTALYAGVGAGATGLIGAAVSLTTRKAKEKRQQLKEAQMMEAIRPGMIELETPEVPRAKKRNKTITAIGAAGIAAGASVFPSARRLIGIKVRQVGAKNFGIEEAGRNIGGKTVADYIEAAQLGLNTGLKGKAVGKVIEHTLAHPEGKVAKAFKKFPGQLGSGDIGQRLATEHYARFRASPKSALGFWDYEHGLMAENLVKKQDERLAAKGKTASAFTKNLRQRDIDEMHYGREKAHSAIAEQMEIHGKSEMDAIKHVAYNHQDPQVQNYFNQLAKSKLGAVDQYAKKALISPGLIAGGTGAVIYGRKKNESPSTAVRSAVRLERIALGLTEFETTERTKRIGARLDKYEKTIRAREIDRHIHDYLRAAAIGGLAGAAIPGRVGLKGRVLAGAGVGVAGQGVLHSAGHVDEYGEQTEEAKVLQRNAPKYVGGAVILGGLLARRRPWLKGKFFK